jgi:ABC-type sugar transport system permease subunit
MSTVDDAPRNRFWIKLKKMGIPIYLTLSPILLLIVFFRIFPTLRALQLSLTNANMLNLANSKYVGFTNLIKLYTRDPVFWVAFKNTLVYAFSTAFLGLPLALLIAMGLHRSSTLVSSLGLGDAAALRLRRFFTFFYFAPFVTPVVAICVLFTWMFQRFGLFNAILEQLNLPPQPFISESSHALPSLIGMVIWRDLGFGMVMYLVGLLGIPAMYFEAAKIDGASGWQVFRNVTLPLLTRTTQFVAVVNIINGFIAFTAMKVITDGGPGKATTVMTIHIYMEAIVTHKVGYGAAIAVNLFLVVLVVTLIQMRVLRARWTY